MRAQKVKTFKILPPKRKYRVRVYQQNYRISVVSCKLFVPHSAHTIFPKEEHQNLGKLLLFKYNRFHNTVRIIAKFRTGASRYYAAFVGPLRSDGSGYLNFA